MILMLMAAGSAVAAGFTIEGLGNVLLRELESRLDTRDLAHLIGKAELEYAREPFLKDVVPAPPELCPWKKVELTYRRGDRIVKTVILASEAEHQLLLAAARNPSEEAGDLALRIANPLVQGARARELNMAAA